MKAKDLLLFLEQDEYDTGYHIAPSKMRKRIKKEGLKGKIYVWTKLKVAQWFKKLHEDPEESDDAQPMDIWNVDISGIPSVVDPETEDMTYWSSKFTSGWADRSGLIMKVDHISSDRLMWVE